jgi:hypothetical protein
VPLAPTNVCFEGNNGHGARCSVINVYFAPTPRRNKDKFTASIAAQLRCRLGTLAMTPSDRSRVTARAAEMAGEMVLHDPTAKYF